MKIQQVLLEFFPLGVYQAEPLGRVQEWSDMAHVFLQDEVKH